MKPESPSEPFKRAVSVAVRSLAAEPELEVAFSSEAPLADVLGLLVRESLTGEKPPASVANAVELWRPYIEGKAGGDLAKLTGALRDQKAFARLTRAMLNHLALGDQSDSASDDDA